MKCMYCKKEIVEKLSFNNVFSKKDSLVLCEECKYNIDINITELAEYTLYYFGDYEFLKEIIYIILNTLGRFIKRKDLESFLVCF